MSSRVTAVRPAWAIEGGRITIQGTDFPLDRPQRARASTSAACPRASCRRRPPSLGVIVPSGLDGGAVPISDRRPGRQHAVCRHRRRRSRRDCIRSTTRCSIAKATSTSPTAARAASRCRSRFSRCARTARARRSRRASSTPRRWRLVRTASSTSRAVSKGRSTGSTPMARSSRSPPISASHAGWRSPTTASLFVGDRSGTLFRVDRSGEGAAVCDAAAQHRRVSSRHRPRPRHLRHRADAVDLRLDLQGRTPDGTVSTLDGRFGRPQGIAFDASGTLFVVEALAGASGLYRLTPGRARPSSCSPVRISSASRSIRSAAWSCAPNETAYRLT